MFQSILDLTHTSKLYKIPCNEKQEINLATCADIYLVRDNKTGSPDNYLKSYLFSIK